MMGLTPQLVRCKAIIVRSFKAYGCAPSFEDIMDEMGLGSKSGVFRMMKELEQRGHIRRLPGQARAIEIIEPDSDCRHCGHPIGSEACRISAENSTITYSATPPKLEAVRA